MNLPWLQAVQDRATKRTEHLGQEHLGQEAAAPQPEPKQNQSESAAGQNAPAEQEKPAEPEQAEQKQANPDEPPPDWVVGILEPGSAPQQAQENYEPEELSHIMPWLGTQAGENGEPTPGQGLPPWLNGITVQETLETRQPDTQPSPISPPPSDPDLEGLQPFVPPEIQAEGTETEPNAPAAQEQEKVPEWLKRLETRKPPEPEQEPEPALDRFTPVTQVVLSPTETLGRPISREVPVRPPRPGAVETLAALIQEPPNSAPRAVPSPTSILRTTSLTTAPTRSPLARWLMPDGLIYLIILAALLAVLIVQPPFGQVSAPAATDAIEFYNAVDRAPRDKPALLVFDWDASRYAEMSALSAAVTNHLMARHIRFLTVSTVPQGPGFAQQITQDAATDPKSNYGYTYGRDYLVLGYLPGGEAALRSLGSDMTGVLPLDYVNNSLVANTDFARSTNLRNIQDFGIVIDLAADETALRTWIEQVAARTRVPLIAAVPQALEPLARPYRNIPGAGLLAVVSGQTGAFQYEEQLTSHNLAGGAYNTQNLESRLNAQSVGQLIVALAILAAFVSMGTLGIFRR